MKKLTKKQEWMLAYLKGFGDFISPTEVGRQYGLSIGRLGYHSSVASPVLKSLVELGLVERNQSGHYKYIETEVVL